MIYDFEFYSKRYMKIKTKLRGLRPFSLRDYQYNFVNFIEKIEGPKRVIVLKPRQAGFSTLAAGIFFHKMATQYFYTGIAMADKKGRTLSIRNIYNTFLQELDPQLKPLVLKDNSEEIFFDNPREKDRQECPGLSSGILFETANDPNAGRSSPRKFAHLSECAFYRYSYEIDEGVQNSIPLSDETLIIKESTANGRAGNGKAFYELWQAAIAGDSIYKPYFIAWDEIEDYRIVPPLDFKPTKEEKEILKVRPSVTEANLAWRRLKLTEYMLEDDNNILSPEERFKQDFPLTPEEAFRSTGSPVFDQIKINTIISELRRNKVNDIKDRLGLTGSVLKNHFDRLKIFSPARQGKDYFIGCDVSEGLAQGDASSIFVLDDEYNQVASWYGKIDPDLLGHLLIDLGIYYNNALLIPEKNNMGHTTVTTIRNEGYPKLYKRVVEDKITKEKSTKYGWTTNSVSKMEMLNEAIKMLREGNLRLLDLGLVEEMSSVTRRENGNVDLNGQDRTVSLCLALMGAKHYRQSIVVKPKINRELYDVKEKRSKGVDIFD